MIVCVSKYRTDRLDFKPGDVITDERIIEFVMRDSPASFEVRNMRLVRAPKAAADDVTVTAFEQPPESKVVRRGRR